MLEDVNCVYRVGLQGEWIPGHYHIASGQIIGEEGLFTVDTSAYVYHSGNYEDGTSMGLRKLYNYFTLYPYALAVIDIDNVGVIVVTVKSSFGVYGELEDLTVWSSVPLRRAYRRDVEVAGAIKTKTYTRDCEVPQQLLIVDKTNGQRVVHTSYGIKEVAFEYDAIREGMKVDMSRHMELCNTEDGFASCLHNGTPRLLRIKGGSIVYL